MNEAGTKFKDALFAGFGGHGMLLAGKLLAQAVMNRGSQVSWLPAYGAEMRGGTANVTVCMSNEAVSSPYIELPSSLVVMNTPSLHKFGPRVKPGGLIIINSTLVREDYKRDDCTILTLPAGEIASEIGSIKSANLVLLGAYVGLSGIVDDKAIIEVIEDQFAPKARFIPGNVAAFKAGYQRGLAARGGENTAGLSEQKDKGISNAHRNSHAT